MHDSTNVFRLRIWRPCQWYREVSDSAGRPLDAEQHYEPIYTWTAPPGIAECIVDPRSSERLQGVLTDAFTEEMRLPISHLATILESVDAVLSRAGASDWSDSEEEKRLNDMEAVSLRFHPLLAFRLHLEWLIDTFGQVPEATISLQ